MLIKNEKRIETFLEKARIKRKRFLRNVFSDKGIPFFVVQKIRQILEEVLDADLSRLSSKDDFQKFKFFLGRRFFG